MLEVSARSWHYRLWDSLWPDPPTNLCAYFWGCVLAALYAIIDPIAKLVGKFNKWLWVFYIVLAAMLIFLVISLVLAILENPWNALWIPLIMVGTVAGLFLALALIVVVLSYLDPDWEKNGTREKKGASGLRVTWVFLKARKQKVCPLITVTENDDQPNLKLVE